ncbi:MAG: biotin--[acetyl-CoA-carboxylase] ligase, partial [Elusimicrobia bacterium]|nr:biotin--[acetyl-CoA-carboxylase] ligase [Elusimicrobiota bacterium]
VVDSTQTIAKNLARQGDPEGTLILADRQTAGYGRKGDPWHSGRGGLWFSLILKPVFAPDKAEEFSLACAEAVAQTLNRYFPGHLFKVKPPNDVMDASARKVCGLLLEGSITGGFYDWLVMGLGLNVNNKIPGELKSRAVSLKEICGRRIAGKPLLAALTGKLMEIYRLQNLR